MDPGGSIKLTVKFIATSGNIGSGMRYESFLTINSNDPTSPKKIEHPERSQLGQQRFTLGHSANRLDQPVGVHFLR